jgi:hypothetical protein
MGLTEKDVMVVAYSTLRTKFWKKFFTEVTEIRYGQPTRVYKWAALPFQTIIADECQALKNPDAACTKMFEGFLRADGAEDTHVIIASATPFVTLADTRIFTLAARIKWMGEVVNNDNFDAFARQFILKEGGSLDDANAAAIERYKKYMGRAIIDPPRDPVKTKMRLSVNLIDFPDEARRQMYNGAVEAWVKAVERSGGKTDTSARGEILRAFGIYIGAEEWAKCQHFAEEAARLDREGFAPVLCVRRQESLIDIVGRLARMGYSRDDLTIVWGGKKIIHEDEVFDSDTFARLTIQAKTLADQRIARGEPVGDRLSFLSRKDKAKYRKTMRFNKERFFKNETRVQTRERISWLDNMSLDTQSLEEQEVEVENFLSGRSKICIYTMSAGGVGIDFDAQRPGARPRRGIFTISYWAEEVVQSTGRFWRPASSLFDAEGAFVFLKNTIAATHMAPKLAKKISSISAMCQSGIDFEEMLEDAVRSGSAPIEELSTEAVEVTEDVADLVEEDEEESD